MPSNNLRRLVVGTNYLQWPPGILGETLDHVLDVTRDLADAGDVILTAAVSLTPSGAGEAQVVSGTLTGNVVSARVFFARASRTYTMKVLITAVSGQTYEYFVGLPVSNVGGTFPVPPPPSVAYSTPLSVTRPNNFDFANSANAAAVALL